MSKEKTGTFSNLNWYIELQDTRNSSVWALILDPRGVLIRVEYDYWLPYSKFDQNLNYVSPSNRSEPEILKTELFLVTVPLEFVYTQGTVRSEEEDTK